MLAGHFCPIMLGMHRRLFLGGRKSTRWEPGALAALAGICVGGRSAISRSYRDRRQARNQGPLDIEPVAAHLDSLGAAQFAPIDCGCSVGTGSQLWLYIGRFSPQLA